LISGRGPCQDTRPQGWDGAATGREDVVHFAYRAICLRARRVREGRAPARPRLFPAGMNPTDASLRHSCAGKTQLNRWLPLAVAEWDSMASAEQTDDGRQPLRAVQDNQLVRASCQGEGAQAYEVRGLPSCPISGVAAMALTIQTTGGRVGAPCQIPSTCAYRSGQ
jgi:hypothetical protein